MFEGRRRILEAAHLVYYQFWGEQSEHLGHQLQPVPGYGHLQYLNEERINSLGLKTLDYNEVVLLVREEYEVAYNYLRLCEGNPDSRGGGMVVTGQPGIGLHLPPTTVSFANNRYLISNPGKTCFLYYLLFRLLGVRKTVALQVRDNFVLFQGTGVHLEYDMGSAGGHGIPSGAWALTDSHSGFKEPCPPFLTAQRANGAWVVQTTSPSKDKWATWRKEYTADLYWMDVFSLDELKALG